MQNVNGKDVILIYSAAQRKLSPRMAERRSAEGAGNEGISYE